MVSDKLYGYKEHAYCEPFAEALVENAAFRRWVLERLGLREFAKTCCCLREQQRARGARFWWKNYYCHESRCSCPGLRGREIDVLAVFRDESGQTVGLHVECKRPGDKFSADQANGYRIRADCWSRQRRNPPTVIPHEVAKTLLICDRGHTHAESNVMAFDDILYFDQIRDWIPGFPAG